MTDNNNPIVTSVPFVDPNAPVTPTLTLNPSSVLKQAAVVQEAVEGLQQMAAEVPAQAVAQAVAEAPVVAPSVQEVAQAAQAVAPAAQVASEAVSMMDSAQLTEEDRRAIDAFVKQIDVNNTDHVLLFGADAQKKIADFSDSALATVRTKDTGEVGDMLTKLVNEIKGFGAAAEKPKGLRAIGWNARKAMADMTTKYDKVEVNVDAISAQLEKH